MTAPVAFLPLLEAFVQCFTSPGFAHFTHFVVGHGALWGAPHCVSETLRATRWHAQKHWTSPYAWLSRGAWSCRKVSQALLDLLLAWLGLDPEIILVLDDTLAQKSGRKFFGLGYYPDPTDKNPGGSRRRVLGHVWVVLGLLAERSGRWLCFPLAARLFVPDRPGQKDWPYASKIELAIGLIEGLKWGGRRATLVVDNLYAKGLLLAHGLAPRGWTMVSRLRSNAALYELPGARKPGQRGARRKRGDKLTARQLWNRRSGRRELKVRTYGKARTITAWVGTVIPSPTLGDAPIRVVIFPQRRGKKMNVLFSTDTAMTPERLLELYAARFKIEDAFDELKTHGGLGDYRTRSLASIKRHVTLCVVAYSLLRLLSVTLTRAQAIEAEPWWHPQGPPSVTRLRRALAKASGISASLLSREQSAENPALRMAT